MTNQRIAMDIGGTFTDVVVYDEHTGKYRAGKSSTTPTDLTDGVLRAIDGISGSVADASFVVHGTTQGLNAFLQRKGVPVLLLATEGVGDVYHIARGPRSKLYDLHYRKPEPLVPLRDIVEIGGRFDAQGEELKPLDEDAIRRVAQRYREGGYGAIAVAYLFSYSNPQHELRTREILQDVLGPEVPISLSHEAAKEWREYERTSSAVVEAYTGPVVRTYLSKLEGSLAARTMTVPLHVMQSSGGILSASSARERPLQTLLSGPVGGAIGNAALSDQLGIDNLIGIDMGGTSFDVSLVIDGKPDITPEAQLEGLPLLMSVINIHTIGAGGGSIAWTEAGGLRVGPASAGATPGPVCYGRGGTAPTVTDANLVLGRIDESWFAGGQMTLDLGAAENAIATLGEQFGLSTLEMAEGICDVANAKMAQAIRTITVSRGIEPRDFTLVAFGGAGPMHAVFLADEIGIRRIVVPRFPGAFSAWGMLQAQIRRDLTEPFFCVDEDFDAKAATVALHRMQAEGLASLDDEGVPPEARSASHAVDVRYVAQEYTLTVPILSAEEPVEEDFIQTIAERFGRAHQERYGHSNLGAPIELVMLRTAVHGDLGRAEAEHVARARNAEFPHQTKKVRFRGKMHPTPVIRRDDLAAGHRFAGPAVVVESTATTVVPPGFDVELDTYGALIITRKEG